MELLGLIVVMLLYIIGLYVINKNKANNLVKDLMKYAQVIFNDSSVKKDFVKSVTSELISDNNSGLPFSKTITKVVENKIDNIIEEKLPEVKAEKIDLSSAMNTNNILAERVLESDSKGLITIYGRVTGGEIKKVEYEAGINYIIKKK